ncbi:molybdate ABC transporter permease [Alteromonas sp. KUL156]|uniref:molybdate ABC transporter permease subunit n=1 Tax=Alteromonas sp. KUL106 TaxID=2480799 RepID=UPI0012E5B7CC|nr:molybdate ABC transporter permease subunit [Alteromonas sp. KUL106]GFD67897.1 molybdate ABC transporter permease [Alteromonas sp. KUL106]GFD81798.1 molybdate ABC transporter permease [Tenacibaculum sp. KUL118]GFD91878.1 molybdate ABC transporter permease [Alteromonas sp. KUL154]GFD97813.1 molybdate ABC transporter permease [Alteromonas sp. KUL156]
MLAEFFGASTLEAILLTLKLAFITSTLLLLIALPLAWFLANWQSNAKPLVMSVLALPLVLPPTVLGFYLLVAFSPQGALGQGWQSLTGSSLAFSFEGLVLGSVIYSLPFALQPLYSGFSQLDGRYLDVAKTLGFSATEAFMKIVLPLSKAPIVVALGLSFAHTIGEFGVVLMIGGNIPGETQVLSIALYEQVEALEYDSAHNLALALLIFSFVMLAALYRFNGISRSVQGR